MSAFLIEFSVACLQHFTPLTKIFLTAFFPQFHDIITSSFPIIPWHSLSISQGSKCQYSALYSPWLSGSKRDLFFIETLLKHFPWRIHLIIWFNHEPIRKLNLLPDYHTKKRLNREMWVVLKSQKNGWHGTQTAMVLGNYLHLKA